MRFASTRGGQSYGFLDATLRGYPSDGGLFRPAGEADIRTAIYSPAAGFTDVVALAASELLSADLDPRRLLEIIDRAYAWQPLPLEAGLPRGNADGNPGGGAEGLFALDLSVGPTGSAADYGASFTAAFLDSYLDSGAGLVVAAAKGREASALAAAFSRPGAGQPCVLLLPEGERLHLPAVFHEGLAGRVLVLEVKGGESEARALERRLSGRMAGGRICVPAGQATPSRLIGRSLLLIGLFSIARAGLSGDLIVAAPPGDLLGLVTGLWAWSWGLPVTAFLLPRLPGEPSSALLLDLLAAYGDSDEASGAEFLERFDAEFPLSSLVLRAPAGHSGENAPSLLPSSGPSALDLASSHAASAALAALEAGLAGHSRIVVPRFLDPFWDGAPPPPRLAGAEQGLAPAASIDGSIEELQSALELLR